MHEQKIQEIKDQIRTLVNNMLELGGEPPADVLDMLSQFIQKQQTQINQLRAEQQKQNAPNEQTTNGNSAQLSQPTSYDSRFLWILAGRQPQAFISYLRNFPTPSTQSLLKDPGQLNATIEQLQREMPSEGRETLVEDGIAHAPLQSSNVWGARYDPRTGQMRVRFQGGSVYEYDGIPRAIFDAFIHGNAEATTKGQNQYGRWWRGKNPSLGAALNQYVKQGGFNYRRIR